MDAGGEEDAVEIWMGGEDAGEVSVGIWREESGMEVRVDEGGDAF